MLKVIRRWRRIADVARNPPSVGSITISVANTGNLTRNKRYAPMVMATQAFC